MKEEKFKILQFIREFIVRVENELENFPKKDIEIKMENIFLLKKEKI